VSISPLFAAAMANLYRRHRRMEKAEAVEQAWTKRAAFAIARAYYPEGVRW
jgi:hypothetical protein